MYILTQRNSILRGFFQSLRVSESPFRKYLGAMEGGRLLQAVKLRNLTIRRICPGRYLANANIWIAVATMLSTFDILKPLDENGNEGDPPMNFSKVFGT